VLDAEVTVIQKVSFQGRDHQESQKLNTNPELSTFQGAHILLEQIVSGLSSPETPGLLHPTAQTRSSL
jgi:hypothetical protein